MAGSRRYIGLWCAALLAVAVPSAAAACGSADESCAVEGGTYRLALPPEAAPGAGPVPAVFYLHGWGASAAGAMEGRKALRRLAAERGYALIAPQGVPRQGRTQRDWAVRDGRPHPRDDLAFFEAVLADAATRGVDTGRVLLSGFSRGGSMVWYVACERPEMFRAYAPVAGAFWVPMPTACVAPAEPLALTHIHGWDDRVVPLEGRLIGGGRLVQGDVFESLAILRRTLGCEERLPDDTAVTVGDTAGSPLWERRWTSCTAGRIDFTLHPGGHIVPAGWAESALDWFDARLSDAAPVGE